MKSRQVIIAKLLDKTIKLKFLYESAADVLEDQYAKFGKQRDAELANELFSFRDRLLEIEHDLQNL